MAWTLPERPQDRSRVSAAVHAPYRALHVRLWAESDGRQRVYVRMRGCERADAAEAVELLNRAAEIIFRDSVANGIRLRQVR